MITLLADRLARVIGIAMAALIVVIVISTAAQVFWRYVLSAPLLWPEEVARHSFIWVSFLGMSLLLRRDELIAVDILRDALNPSIRRWLVLLVRLLMAPLLVVLVWQGAAMIQVVSGQVTSSTQIPVGWLYLAAPVGGLFGLFFTLERLIADAARRPDEQGSPP